MMAGPLPPSLWLRCGIGDLATLFDGMDINWGRARVDMRPVYLTAPLLMALQISVCGDGHRRTGDYVRSAHSPVA